jgi:hypothetical protein
MCARVGARRASPASGTTVRPAVPVRWAASGLLEHVTSGRAFSRPELIPAGIRL